MTSIAIKDNESSVRFFGRLCSKHINMFKLLNGSMVICHTLSTPNTLRGLGLRP